MTIIVFCDMKQNIVIIQVFMNITKNWCLDVVIEVMSRKAIGKEELEGCISC